MFKAEIDKNGPVIRYQFKGDPEVIMQEAALLIDVMFRGFAEATDTPADAFKYAFLKLLEAYAKQ